jgi:hypothetical protein
MTRNLRHSSFDIRHFSFVLLLLLAAELCIAFFAIDFSTASREMKEFISAGKEPNWEDVADVAICYAAGANALLLALLWALSGKWGRPFITESPDLEGTLVRAPVPAWQRWLWPAAALLGMLWYGSMSFATKSLWWDELWQVKNASHGSWKPGKEGELKFSHTSWKRCAFYYQKPTNHVPMALLQKFSITCWNKVTGAKPGQFSDLAARLPALLASGTAVVLAFRYIGHLGGVSLMALMLLLHPWHLRYGVEARSYALLVPLAFSGLLACRAVVISQARDWRKLTWLGLNQALWIWAFPFAVIDVALLFVAVAWLLMREHKRNSRDKSTALLRWLVTHTLAAALVLQLFLPCALQAVYAKEKHNTPQLLDTALVRETFSQLAFGMDWKQIGEVEAAHLTSTSATFGSDTLALVAMAVVLGAALLGIRSLMERMPRMGLISVCPLVAGLLFMLVAWRLGLFFYPRFVIGLLPAWIIGLAEVPALLADYAQTRRKIAVGMMAAFAYVTLQQRAVLGSVSYTAYRPMAEFIQAQGTPPPLVCVLGLGREALPLYLPEARAVTTVAEIEAAMTEAERMGKVLFVFQGYKALHELLLPAEMQLLTQSGKFLKVTEWPGLEEKFFFRLWQAK